MKKTLRKPVSKNDIGPKFIKKKIPSVLKKDKKRIITFDALSMVQGVPKSPISTSHIIEVARSERPNLQSETKTVGSQLSVYFSDIPAEELESLQLNSHTSELKRIPTLDIRPEDSSKSLLKPGTLLSRMLLTVELFFLAYIVIIIPLKLSFFLYEEITSVVPFLDKITKGFLFVQFILRFFTPIYINYELESNPKAILLHTIKSPTIYLDFYAMIPWNDLFFEGFHVIPSFTLSTIVYSSFLVSLYKLYFQLEDYKKDVSSNFIWHILKKYGDRRTKDTYTPALIILLALCHFYSCLYFYVGTNYQGHNNWLVFKGKQNKPVLDRYIACLNFVAQTFSTAGFGEYVANTNLEKALRCLYIFTGVAIYALCTGEVNVQTAKLITWKELAERKMTSLRELAKLYELDPFVVGKVENQIMDISVLDQMTTNKNGDLVFIDRSLHQLDFRNLNKEEIDGFYFALYHQRFKGLKIFQTFDSEFILELGACVQKRDFKAGQIIYTKEEPAANMFILEDGQVEFMLNRFDEIPFMRIEKGYFGEYELIFNVNRVFTVKALTDVSLYHVGIDGFKRIFMSEKYKDFAKAFTIKASDRINKFNQIHNKFDLLIKNKLSKSEAFKSVQNLLATAFKAATGRKRAAPANASRLTLFNQETSKKQELPKDNAEGRLSLNLNPNSPFLSKLKQKSANLQRMMSSHDVNLTDQNASTKASPDTKSAVNIGILRPRAPAVKLLQPKFKPILKNKDKVQVVKLEQMKKETLSVSVHSHSGSDIESNHEESDVEEKKKNPTMIPKRALGKNQVRRVTKKDLDPTTPSNSNPLFLAFSNLYNKRTKR